MKKITLNIRREDFENIKPVLEKLFYWIIQDAEIIQAKVFVQDADLDEVIEKLREPLDLRFKENLIEVSTPDFVISPSFSHTDNKKKKSERAPVEKLISTAKNYDSIDYWTVLLTAIAGMIALTGLFLNNVAIVIGAMLLSPLLGPIHSFVIYAATGRTREALQSILVLFIFLGVIFAVSVVATFLIGTVYGLVPESNNALLITDEILLRTGSSPIYIFMAVLLGMASMIALTKGFSEFIAGVAVAAALLPPAVVAGISLVLITDKTIGAILLVFDNVIGLMAGAMIATLLIGITPRTGCEQRVAKKTLKRAAEIIVILIAILSVMSLFF